MVRWLAASSPKDFRNCMTNSLMSASASAVSIVGNEMMDHLAKETIDHNIAPLPFFNHADLSPLVNPISNRRFKSSGVYLYMVGIYLLRLIPGPSKKFRNLTRGEDVVITRLRIGHTLTTVTYLITRTTYLPPASIVTRLGPSDASSWSVQCYSKVVVNTTQLTHLGPFLKMFPKHAS